MVTYKPKNVVLALGPHIASGWKEGTFIKLKWNNPEAFKRHVGGGGEVARTERVDLSGTIEISLMQGSPTHAYLHNLRKLAGTFPTIFAYRGDFNFSSPSTASWIEKLPDEEFATEYTPREWVLAVEDMSMITI